jgi:hypothetical protein
LRQEKLYAKLSKCVFGAQEVEYLGFILKAGKLAMNPNKTSAIEVWETPTSKKELQSFLGLVNYYRRFIRNCSKITKPLTELTKNVPFIDVTPHHLWYGTPPDLSHVRVFGSKCWYTVPRRKLKKLDPRSREAVMMGYSNQSKGYKLWDIILKKFVISRDVTFLEEEKPLETSAQPSEEHEPDTFSLSDEDSASNSSPPPPTNWTTKNLPPLPPLSLPPPAIAIGPNPVLPEPTPLPSHDFRIPRRSPTTAPKSLGRDPGHIPIIDLTAQKHIQRTVKRRETSALRLQRRRGFKSWICEPCGKVCRNSLAKADHLKTRKHLRRTEYKGQHCTLCDFLAKSPEDFERRIQGRRHKQRIGHHLK